MASTIKSAQDPSYERVLVRQIPTGHQWSFRTRRKDLQDASAAWLTRLDLEPLSSSSLDGHHALRLGPDEWLLLAGSARAADALTSLAETTALSLVDISDRELAWELSGVDATRVLATGCPLDLSDASFPAGRATRTVFGHAEVVLWRPDLERTWQIRALRSFATYITSHLAHAIQQCATP